MRADDDGFVGNPKKILRMIGGNDDDLKILIAKRFVLIFETGVIVIKHWRINNLVRKDWYRETSYIEEKKQLKIKENGAYTELVNENTPTRYHRLGKVRLGKDIIIASDDAQNINKSKEITPLKELYEKMGIPKPVRIVNQWQDEASNAIKYFPDGEEKRSSVFKCFKDNQQKARIAFSDCKELEKRSVLYFLKVYNEIKK
jgi:hypothetical protein